MRDKLIELLCNSGFIADTSVFESLADHLIENGVILPPCKVGDILYDIYGGENIKEIKVTKINVRFDERNKPWLIIGGLYYAFDDFGKDVFFTFQDAEKALRGEGE